MKFAMRLFAICFFGMTCLWAQSTPQSPAPSSPMHNHMMAMHHHMMEMQEQVKDMRTTLEKMKANLDKITDPALKQQAQYDVDLWEQMVEHMEHMSKMMSDHMEMMHDMQGKPGMHGMMQGMQNQNQNAAPPANKP